MRIGEYTLPAVDNWKETIVAADWSEYAKWLAGAVSCASGLISIHVSLTVAISIPNAFRVVSIDIHDRTSDVSGVTCILGSHFHRLDR